MEKKLFIILGVILLFGCNKRNDESILSNGTVIVAGNIQNQTDKVVSLAFQDIIRSQARFSQIINPNTGDFNFVFDVYHSQDIRFIYEGKSLQLYIEPGDSLFIKIDANECEKDERFWKTAAFSGSNSEVNDQILKYSVLKETLTPYIDSKGMSINQYLMDLKQQIENEEEELALFVAQYKPSEKFIHWAQKDIIYSNANYLIDYKFINKPSQTDSLFDTNIFPINDENALVSSMFGLHLWHYAADKYIQNDRIVMKNLESEKYFNAYSKCIENVLNEEPTGIIRDIMVYKLLSALLEESVSAFDSIWIENNKVIDNNLLNSELNEREFQVKNANNYSIGFLDNFSGEEKEFIGDIFEEIFDRSEDKLLYVDIWATWCGPCRSEIPHLIEIGDYLVSKNIELISICCNSDRAIWDLVIKENKMPGKHYFLDQNQTDLFISKLKFGGYPTYLLIKNREIVNYSAPRPSAKEKLLNMINSIVET